ncbi:rabenosyn-5 isoform X3 [Willisornis vidua]|uniref:Rabenosyn-5 isoform X3 n=1 Tax=Willisornis vidua TaxID=1566151 RepID=A0ABQ9DC46_9PASS|nr:rabenosyn-5 isoform X3 [Willisornis vidua]
MAAGCPAAFGDPGEVREGFLCPLCLKDLQAFRQLQAHYEEQHPGEERHVRAQLRNLVQKAKRAKKKLLKQEGDDRTDSGSQERYESFSYGGVDPYMWEPQEVAIEKSVVPWVSDQDVPFCPDCGSKFGIRNRRHHCRLCGSIMCKKCMELISLPLASKLTSASKEALGSHTSPNSSPSSVHGSRRGSISSISSVSSVLDEKDDDRIRCCRHCKDTLLKREQQIDEKEHTPEIVKLYEEKLLGLMSLPTKDQYEELKKRRLHMVALETQGKQEENQKEFVSRSAAAVNGDETHMKTGTVRKSEGWLPTSSISRESERADPLLQQIDNITSFIKQAKAANRIDEVHMLQENLMQLQDEYDQQQTLKAIELSKKQAEEEEMQREELQVLCEKEWEREHHKFMSQHSRTRSLDFREVKQHLDIAQIKGDTSSGTPAVEQLPPKEHLTFTLKAQSVPQCDRDQPAYLNPFEDEADAPQAEEDPANPFAKDTSPMVSFSNAALQGDKKEYNPFESEEEDEQSNGAPGSTLNPFEEDENPLEKPGGSWNSGNPFEERSSTNPFEVEDGSEISGEEAIEEELLLQQIDNIKAYIFDAKHSGRLDEVELLTENLKELKHTLAKQKEKSNC